MTVFKESLQMLYTFWHRGKPDVSGPEGEYVILKTRPTGSRGNLREFFKYDLQKPNCCWDTVLNSLKSHSTLLVEPNQVMVIRRIPAVVQMQLSSPSATKTWAYLIRPRGLHVCGSYTALNSIYKEMVHMCNPTASHEHRKATECTSSWYKASF